MWILSRTWLSPQRYRREIRHKPDGVARAGGHLFRLRPPRWQRTEKKKAGESAPGLLYFETPKAQRRASFSFVQIYSNRRDYDENAEH